MSRHLNIFNKDGNGRAIEICQIGNAEIVNGIEYPNSLVYEHTSKKIIRPIQERTMSLPEYEHTFYQYINCDAIKLIDHDVFFFLYNTDNYYHFVYDTLPYLISYFEVKRVFKDLKLLIAPDTYPFVMEFLELAGVTKADILIAEEEVQYKNMIVSDSYTHGIDSNLPPRKEVYTFLQSLSDKVEPVTKYGDKIYISRRSWIHNDKTNMGTDYTTRRKMKNEDKLVDFLASIGYNEVFTELLSTKEKLGVFKQATHVVGAIGGGLCNVLFSPPSTKLDCIVSPGFLDVNQRFTYSFANIQTRYFDDTSHVDDSYFKKYMRVKFGNQIGEIQELENDIATIAYSDSKVAGWNNQAQFKKITIHTSRLTRLDTGLNSEWSMNLNKFQQIL